MIKRRQENERQITGMGGLFSFCSSSSATAAAAGEKKQRRKKGQRDPKRRHKWTKREVRTTYNKTGGICAYCDRDISPCEKRKGRWAMEHVRPFVVYGDGEWKDWLPICDNCNGRKWKHSAEHFHQNILKRVPRCHFVGTDGKMCTYRCTGYADVNCGRHYFWQKGMTEMPPLPPESKRPLPAETKTRAITSHSASASSSSASAASKSSSSVYSVSSVPPSKKRQVYSSSSSSSSSALSSSSSLYPSLD